MKRYFMYFELQLKMVAKSLPAIFFGTFVLAGLLVLGIYGANSVARENLESEATVRIGLVVYDDNKYTDMALSLLMGEDNIKNLCEFVDMTEEEALSALNKGQVAAVVLIPENFLTSVLNGTNLPARIVMPERDGYSQSILFRELVNAGATDLATAQAAVYAVDDLCIAAGIDAIKESEDYLNKNLFLYALSRNSYMDKQEISTTGDLTLVQFYVASGLVMFLIFGGVICSDLLGRDTSAFGICVGRVGIRRWMVVLAKLLSVSLVYFVLLAASYIVAALCGVVNASIIGFAGIAVLVGAIFAINIFVFQIADNRVSGAICLFVVTIIMMFVGGNIMPAALLPEIVNEIGVFMPTKYLTNLAGQIITGEVLFRNILAGIVILIGFTGFTIVLKGFEGR